MAAVALALAFPAAAPAVSSPGTESRPNILWITTEDLSPVLGCYGDDYAVTPNLDRLAARGVRYTRAFAMASVCTPARSCLITGVYSSSMGTQHLRGPQPLSPQIRCFTEYLREAGYYCTNNSKEDYNFPTPRTAWDESSGKAHWRNRRSGQPFFSIFNFITTHQSRVRYPRDQFEKITARVASDQRHDPERAPLPPYYPDTPRVRQDLAQLYDLVTAMDMQVQDLLDQLKQDGLSEDTIVFFYSDHGTGMPRGKRWLFDSGIHVPLIIHFPPKYQHLAPGKPGASTDRLVSFVDFAPTILSLLGLPIPAYMQGSAFLGSAAGPDRQHVFAIRDRVDEVYEMSRAVRDPRYLYIRNFMPHRARMQYSDYSERAATRQEIRRLAAEGSLAGSAAHLISPVKPPEELYDTQADPHQLNNLISSSAHQRISERLRGELRQWMIGTRDTALLPELEMIARSRGGSPYDMGQSEEQFDVRRVLAAAQLVGRGPESLDALTAHLADADAGVRFWAATGLAAMGRRAEPAKDALLNALTDTSPDVRFAAAEALCAIGGEKRALPILLRVLRESDPVMQLYAAISLANIGAKAGPVIQQIEAARRRIQPQGNYPMYTRWALDRAVRQSREE
jgi:uncharacterized sulfatase